MGFEERCFTYIVASKSRVLYTGVTGNLERRIAAHKRGEIDGFSKQYRCNRLVWFGGTSDVQEAIALEKRIKNWRRQ
jgi:putative endonuclease